MDDLIGKQIAKYQIDKFVTEDLFGKTYAGRDTAINQPVLVRLIAPEVAQQANLAEQFKQFDTKVQRLNHPVFVKMLGFGETGEGFYLVTEMAHGVSLDKALIAEDGETLEWPKPLQIVEQIAGALTALHDLSIFHGPILLQQIWLTKSDTIKINLADVGLNSLRTGDYPADFWPYLAPELFQHGKFTAATDIYALGVLWYRLTWGEFPFTTITYAEAVNVHATARLAFEGDLPEDILKQLVPLLEKALAKQSDERFSSAEAFEKAIRQAFPPPTPTKHIALPPEQDDHLANDDTTVLEQDIIDTLRNPASPPPTPMQSASELSPNPQSEILVELEEKEKSKSVEPGANGVWYTIHLTNKGNKNVKLFFAITTEHIELKPYCKLKQEAVSLFAGTTAQINGVVGITIPKQPDSPQAGTYPFQIKVFEESTKKHLGEVEATVKIEPYYDVPPIIKLTPEKPLHNKACQLIITNRNNTECTFKVKVNNAEDKLTSNLDEEVELKLGPWQEEKIGLKLKAKERRLWGENETIQFTITATTIRPGKQQKIGKDFVLTAKPIIRPLPAIIGFLMVVVVLLCGLFALSGDISSFFSPPTQETPTSAATIVPSPSPTIEVPPTPTPIPPSWPSRIVFQSNRSGNDEIYTIEVRDGTVSEGAEQSLTVGQYPRISPQGDKIVFQSNREGMMQVYVMNVDGSEPVKLSTFSSSPTHTTPTDWQPFPQWSPDGESVVYVTPENKIEILTFSNNETQTIDAGTGRIGNLSLFEEKVVFGYRQNGDSVLRIWDIRTNTLIKDIVEGLGCKNAYSPQWSPDGRRIVFACDQQYIKVVNEDGTGLNTMVTKNDEENLLSNPTWAPDGRSILYTSQATNTTKTNSICRIPFPSSSDYPRDCFIERASYPSQSK